MLKKIKQNIERTKNAIEKGFDNQINKDQLAFLYMPLMHSENIDDQNLSVSLFEKAGLLGELYAVSLAIEEFDTNVIDNFLFRYEIEAKDFETLMLKVFQSATDLEKSVDV